MTTKWKEGNSVSLLENGDQYFPRIIEAINCARHEIFLETFIWLDDPVGQKVKRALIAAAKRGVWVSVLVDGYGSYFLPERFTNDLLSAGIHFTMYGRQPRWLLFPLNMFRRMHRKLLVVDGQFAFIGGINIGFHQVSESGPDFEQDYAAELRGPVVASIRRFVRKAAQRCSSEPLSFVTLPKREEHDHPGGAMVRFVTRDNHRRRRSIEIQFLRKIRRAETQIIIANPYFFPGYHILRELRNAVQRGVTVRLLVQGKVGSFPAKWAGEVLYDFLVESGIEVYEYWERKLHGKIAVIDDDWATIGSSNLDPISLALNLEANIFVRDSEFNNTLKVRILNLLQETKARQIKQRWFRHHTFWKMISAFLLYHFFCHFPGLAHWIPPAELPDHRSWRRTVRSRRKLSAD